MTNDKVNEVLRRYQDRLRSDGWVPVRGNQTGSNDRTMALNHLVWMCVEALSFAPERIEKKMRWLGFIQGTLWMVGAYTIEELKMDNQPHREEGKDT